MADFFDRIVKRFSSDKFIAAVLVAASLFVYANALLNDFVWDDEEQVVKNNVIHDWGNLPAIFAGSTFYSGGAGLSGGFYRPLVTLSYFADYSVWGLNTFGFSAPYKVLDEKFGFTAENVYHQVRDYLAQYIR